MAKQSLLQLEIPRRGRHCALGGENLSPGMEYYSILIEQDQGFLRQDFCLPCWEKTKEESIAKASSHWKSKVPAKLELDTMHLEQDEKAIYLLKEALEKKTAEDDAQAFILALYLARKKQITLRDEIIQEGQKVNLYEDVATEEIFCVRNMELSQLQIQKIQQELAKQLKNKK